MILLKNVLSYTMAKLSIDIEKALSLTNNVKEFVEYLYGLDYRESGPYFLLSYTIGKSIAYNPFSDLCRGIILEKETNKVVCRPFDRFYNLGEIDNTNIDWNKAKIFEKVDGSLVKVWYSELENKWMTSTASTIVTNNKYGFNLHKLISLAFKTDYLQYFEDHLDKENTYMFEVATPNNVVVIRYDKPRFVYLAARNTKTGKYIDNREEMSKLFDVPKEYNFSSLEECKYTANNLPDDDEGYIVYENNIPVAKIKSPAYVAIHHIRGEGLNGYKKLYQLYVSNEYSEFLTYFPEYKDKFNEFHDALKNLFSKVNLKFNEFKHLERKEFSSAVKDYKYKGFLFALYNKQVPDPEYYFKNCLLQTTAIEILKSFNISIELG